MESPKNTRGNNLEPEINLQQADHFKDDYNLKIAPVERMELTDEVMVVAEYEFFLPELISTILAKSVALEKSEEQLSQIQDHLELMIDRLERGKPSCKQHRISENNGQNSASRI